jgi:hypothetical protein
MARWLLLCLALPILIGIGHPASAENPLVKEVAKLLLRGLGATADDADMVIALVRKESRSTAPELSPSAKRVMTSAEREYLKRCPPKDPWEVLHRRPDPPPGASEEEVTCAFLHNLHVEVLELELKLGPK